MRQNVHFMRSSQAAWKSCEKFSVRFVTKETAVCFFNPKSDQHLISPYNINKLSSKQVMRMKKIINQLILPWCNNKFSSGYHVCHWSWVRRIEFLRLGNYGIHTGREHTHYCFLEHRILKKNHVSANSLVKLQHAQK